MFDAQLLHCSNPTFGAGLSSIEKFMERVWWNPLVGQLINLSQDRLVDSTMEQIAFRSVGEESIDWTIARDSDSETLTPEKWRGQMRVLLAVADKNTRALLSSHLHDRGHELHLVRSGIGCISTLQANPPDAIILEQGILWGGSDGVLSCMAEDPSLSEIPAVLLVNAEVQHAHTNHLRIETIVRLPMRLVDLLYLGNLLDGLNVLTNRVAMDRVVEQGAVS